MCGTSTVGKVRVSFAHRSSYKSAVCSFFTAVEQLLSKVSTVFLKTFTVNAIVAVLVVVLVDRW